MRRAPAAAGRASGGLKPWAERRAAAPLLPAGVFTTVWAVYYTLTKDIDTDVNVRGEGWRLDERWRCRGVAVGQRCMRNVSWLCQACSCAHTTLFSSPLPLQDGNFGLKCRFAVFLLCSASASACMDSLLCGAALHAPAPAALPRPSPWPCVHLSPCLCWCPALQPRSNSSFCSPSISAV